MSKLGTAIANARARAHEGFSLSLENLAAIIAILFLLYLGMPDITDWMAGR